MTRFLYMPGSADGHDYKGGFKLKDGFSLAYLSMLEAIADNNM